MTIRISATWHFLRFRTPFRIAHGLREGTDEVIVMAECNGHRGYGEASLPPYLPDTKESTLEVLSHPILRDLQYPFGIPDFMNRLNETVSGAYPAKAAVETALWNLFASVEGKKPGQLMGISGSESAIPHFYTIGIGSENEVIQKIESGLQAGFRHFKLKLDGSRDEETIRVFKRNTDEAFAVDVNQGWSNIDHALSILNLLEENGCMLLEQPFNKHDVDLTSILRQKASIPIIADEACQTRADIDRIAHAFDGINIKLHKCGGPTAAIEMARHASKKNMKTLIGCMSESSIGCGIAEELTPLFDWADLDGPFLTVDIPDPGKLFPDPTTIR